METKTPFQPGIWQVLLQSKLETLVELKFLVLPKVTIAEIHLNETRGNQVQYANKSLDAKQVNFAIHNDEVTNKAQKDHSSKGDVPSLIDKLTTEFWVAEGICALEDLRQDCEDVPLCTETSWSSLSPDLKSEI